MLKALILTWALSSGADLATTDVARHQGGREVWLPDNGLVIHSVVIGTTLAGIAETHYLWKHGHKKAAVLLTLAVSGVHVGAAIHNYGELR